MDDGFDGCCSQLHEPRSSIVPRGTVFLVLRSTEDDRGTGNLRSLDSQGKIERTRKYNYDVIIIDLDRHAGRKKMKMKERETERE